MQEQLMILHLCKTANYSHENFVVPRAHLLAHDVTPAGPTGVSTHVHSQRDDLELTGAPDAELFVNLAALLRAYDNYAVGRGPRQKLFNKDEEAGLHRPVIAVKDVAVVRVNEPARTRPAYQGRG